MRPTFDEIRRAAYDRWERRGWSHGGDRDDWHVAEKNLSFHAQYRTILSHELDAPEPRILGDGTRRRCRFCERSANGDGPWPPRPVIADRRSLLTAEVCEDCQADWRAGLEEELRAFWMRLRREPLSIPGITPIFSVAAFKAMTVGALLLLPTSELRYFGDAMEWVSNPDHDADDRLLDLAECRVYRASFLGGPPRAWLARREDDDDPVPYMLFFLEHDGIMVQIPLPMCLRDEDLDGRAVGRPEVIPMWGRGHDFREAHGVLLPLSVSGRRRGRAPRLASAS